MSHHDYFYQPADDGRQDLGEELMERAVEDTWWTALDPLAADRIASATEACVDTAGSILVLAAYAKRYPEDLQYVRDRLVELMAPAIECQARWDVEDVLERDKISDIRKEMVA